MQLTAQRAHRRAHTFAKNPTRGMVASGSGIAVSWWAFSLML